MTATARRGSAWRVGISAPSNLLGADGDFYLNKSTGDVYQRNGGIYSIVANILGPQGPGAGNTWRSGSAAPVNALGIDGDLFFHTITSDVYQRTAGAYTVIANIKGSTGAPGVTGPQGPQGLTGVNGAVWRAGSGVPANSLGVNGDFYLNNVNGDVYQRSAGIYSVTANIKGAPGAANGTFVGGTITGITKIQTTDAVNDQFVIQMPNSEAGYPFLIVGPANNTVNTENRWFMAHPEGGLCLSSAREPNWAILHLYRWGAGQAKHIIRVTDELAAGPNDLFVVDKDGGLAITPKSASSTPVIVKDYQANTLWQVSQNGQATGRAAARLKSSQQIVLEAMSMKVATGPNAANTATAAATGELRVTAFGLRGGETYTNAYFINDAIVGSGLTLARIGVFNSTFNLVASTATLHATLNGGAPGLVTGALTAPLTPTTDGVYYIGLLCVGTTPPGVLQLPASGDGGGNSLAVNGFYWAWRQLGLADLPATATRATGNSTYWFALG